MEVTAAILEKGNKILIARRAKGKDHEGFWEFPGGKVQKDETPENCLIRELKEEFQIDISVGMYIGESVYEYPNKLINLKAFTCRIINGDIKLLDHDKVMWIHLDKIDKYELLPADVPLIELYDKARNNR